jgi:hypothetical protein
MTYEQELVINDPKFDHELSETLLITPRQFERRIKLENCVVTIKCHTNQLSIIL